MKYEKEYHTIFDKNGDIVCWFWCVSNCLPFDYIADLHVKCKRKFPNAQIRQINVRNYIGKQGRVWWEIKWFKDGFK